VAEAQASSYRRASLFVDFENVYIGLQISSPAAASAFATDPDRCVRWMEQDLAPFRVSLHYVTAAARSQPATGRAVMARAWSTAKARRPRGCVSGGSVAGRLWVSCC
jgi:hypothetical protein